MLVHQIESGLYGRQGKAVTNFERPLPAPQSELARQLLKDPYAFDFLALGEDALERDLERGLLNHIRQFLLELGVGFAFVGSQHHLDVGGQDFYLDLLFYHLRLRCFVVIDLKISDFQPEFAGKMNFYLSAVDDLLRHVDDQPSIGIILCKTRNKVIVEYALLRAYPNFWDIGLVDGVRWLVTLEAVTRPQIVGTPVDLVRLDGSGVHWIQRRPECEEKKQSTPSVKNLPRD